MTEEQLAVFMQNRTRNSTVRETSRSPKRETDKVEPAPRRKYGNVPTVVDGQRFDSKKEAGRYEELKGLELAGAIADLRCQVPFEFNHGRVKIGTYKSDFTYLENGELIVEDVKSVATRDLGVFRLKKRLMLAFFGIEVRIT